MYDRYAFIIAKRIRTIVAVHLLFHNRSHCKIVCVRRVQGCVKHAASDYAF